MHILVVMDATERKESMLKIEKKESEKPVKISIIGRGAEGNEIISLMTKQAPFSYSLLCVNTDIKVLKTCRYPRLLIDKKSWPCADTDDKFENNHTKATEDMQVITDAVKGAELVIIVTAAEGGTGGDAASIIAKCARDQGIMTMGIALSPFKYEGDKKACNARSCLEELKNNVDALFVIPSDSLFPDVNSPSKLLKVYKDRNELVKNVIMSLTEMFNEAGIISLDLQDVKVVLNGEGPDFIAYGEGVGLDDAALTAIRRALNMLKTQLQKGKDVNIIISLEGDLSLVEVKEATEFVKNFVGENSRILFGINDLNGSGCRVLLIGSER